MKKITIKEAFDMFIPKFNEDMPFPIIFGTSQPKQKLIEYKPFFMVDLSCLPKINLTKEECLKLLTEEKIWWFNAQELNTPAIKTVSFPWVHPDYRVKE